MSYQLQAAARELTGKKVQQFRDEKRIPAVVYGFGVENTKLTVPQKDFLTVFSQAGETQIIQLHVENNKPVDVLIKEVQIDPVSGHTIHVDFQAIDASKAVHVYVPIHYVGEAAAVKTGGGSLIKKMYDIHVKCLPKDLVKYVEVDISVLKTFDDIILVRDVKLPENYTSLHDGGEAVATVVAPRIEVMAAPVVTDAAPAAGDSASSAK